MAMYNIGGLDGDYLEAVQKVMSGKYDPYSNQ